MKAKIKIKIILTKYFKLNRIIQQSHYKSRESKNTTLSINTENDIAVFKVFPRPSFLPVIFPRVYYKYRKIDAKDNLNYRKQIDSP